MFFIFYYNCVFDLKCRVEGRLPLDERTGNRCNQRIVSIKENNFKRRTCKATVAYCTCLHRDAAIHRTLAPR